MSSEPDSLKSKANAPVLKTIIIGESSSGKSSLLIRFVDRNFNQKIQATIGVDFKFKYMNINGQDIKLQVWDTAGQERFRTISTSNAVLIVFDVTSGSSFSNVKRWVDEATQNTDNNIPRILVANKCDLESQRVVSTEEGKNLADEMNAEYFETSAKTGYNVDELFYRIAVLGFDVKKVPTAPSNPVTVDLSKQINKKKKCC